MKISEFTVFWDNSCLIFCFVFSTILCGCSNSPSTLFVASDGESLRLYQAVIDARSLLMEMTTRKEVDVSSIFIPRPKQIICLFPLHKVRK